jgi:magnesium chelatase family protein
MVMYTKGPRSECSADIRQRVISARDIQLARAGQPNAHLSSQAVTKHCRLDKICHQLLEDAARQRFFSPRACQRILKVARTLADLEATETIGLAHLAEAISYRMPGTAQIRYCGKNQG